MKNNIKITGIIVILAVIAGAVIIVNLSVFKHSRPNVLVVVLDTTRGDHLSCYGYDRKTSPYIDSLGSEGVVFEFAYSSACWTLPSHATLLTGLEPLEAGATSETLHLPESNKTIAETLNEAGYDTAAFICNSWVSKERGFGQGFGEYYEMWRASYKQDITARFSKGEVATTEKVMDWLNNRTNKKNPFFAFINLNSVHLPYQPPEPYRSDFLRSDYDAADVNRISSIISMWPHLAGKLTLTDHDFEIMRDLYDGEIAFADYCVEQITETLRKTKMLDNTIVIITSDHGESLGEHGRIDHTLNLYETTLRIPLVIRYPKEFAAGTRIQKLVSLVDIVPTLIDLCGIDYDFNGGIAERSLAREDSIDRPFLVVTNERPLTGISVMKKQYPDFDTSTIDYRLGAVRAKDYKLLKNFENTLELYDMKEDPDETHDLGKLKPDLRDKFHRILQSWRDSLASGKEGHFLESQDQESLELLRSLGYVE